MIAYLISAVTFIQWFRRAYFNLHLKVNHLSQTEGWAAGSWFVPIVNLYRPYQIMKELYKETKEFLTEKELNISKSFNTNYLGIWWALWIISSVVGQFVFRYSMRTETLEEISRMTVVSMALNIIGIPLALVTIKVIREYSKVEPLLEEANDEYNLTRHLVP